MLPPGLDGVTLGELAILVGIVAFIVTFIMKAVPVVKKLVHLLDDFAGTDERPGVARRPGLMERLTLVEEDLVAVKETSARADHNTRPNGGSSAYDKLMKEVSGLTKSLQLVVVEGDRRWEDTHPDKFKPIANMIDEDYSHSEGAEELDVT